MNLKFKEQAKIIYTDPPVISTTTVENLGFSKSSTKTKIRHEGGLIARANTMNL